MGVVFRVHNQILEQAQELCPSLNVTADQLYPLEVSGKIPGDNLGALESGANA